MSDSSPLRFCFAYDVVCPYAYTASRRVEAAAQRAGALVEFVPVLLGALYKLTAAPQGKDGSASDVMPPAKRKLLGRDLLLNAKRYGVPLRMHPRHPRVRTLWAMRLLVAVEDNAQRIALTHALYRAHWVLNEDLDDVKVVERYAAEYGVPTERLNDPLVKRRLQANSQLLADRGAFGVPVFFQRDNEQFFFWGGDRLPLVERALGNAFAQLPRLVPHPLPVPKRKTVKVYVDVASPWSFLGWTQLHQLRRVAHVQVVPVLVGAIFNAIGTPTVPMQAAPAAKRRYAMKDLHDWAAFWGERVRWPTKFPIRSVLALRVALVEPAALGVLFRAAWQFDVSVSDQATVLGLLHSAGFSDADAIIHKATTSALVKSQLRENTDDAVEQGVTGVPSYQVDGGPVVWGQDRIDMVMDMACGWLDDDEKDKKSGGGAAASKL